MSESVENMKNLSSEEAEQICHIADVLYRMANVPPSLSVVEVINYFRELDAEKEILKFENERLKDFINWLDLKTKDCDSQFDLSHDFLNRLKERIENLNK